VKRALWIALFVAVGGVVAWLVVPTRRIEAAPPATAALDGHPLPMTSTEAALTAAREDARSWLEGTLTIVVAGKRVEHTREQLGARIDGAHLEALVRELTDATSPLRRAHGKAGAAHRPDRPVLDRLGDHAGRADADEGRAGRRARRRAL
jgi:hypothetical protein